MKTKTIKKAKLWFVAVATFFVAFYVAANYDPALFNDSDQDGLSDAEEQSYGTSPDNRDTDGDGYTDGVEVKSGYDPLKPAPGDRIVPENISVRNTAPQGGLTNKFVSTMTEILNDSDGEDISVEEIRSYFDENIGGELKKETYTEIVAVNKEDIKIMELDSDLQGEDKAKVQKVNYVKYISDLAILFAETPPLDRSIDSDEDMDVFFLDMQNNFSENSPENINKEYIKRLAEKADNFVKASIDETRVPENLLEPHSRLLGTMNALAELKENSIINDPGQDPLSNIIILVRLRTLLGALNDYYITPFNAKLNEI